MNDLEFEKEYWGNCANTFDEEQKHFIYAKYMKIPIDRYSFDAGNKAIVDIGGGPVSMLLKCKNLVAGLVVDPLDYPSWTIDRYKSHNIKYSQLRGEDLDTNGWDEAWIYNCLQHADDPKLIIENAFKAANTVRIFEWINIPAHEGHPHELTEKFFQDCFTGTVNFGYGTVKLAEQGCYGEAFYGVFKKVSSL